MATPANIALRLQGKEPLSPKDIGINANSFSDAAGQGFDYLTGNQFIPQTLGEKALGTGAEFLGGGAQLAKAGATKLSPIAMKYLAPQGAAQYASLGAAGAGLEAGKEMFPDSAVGQIGTSIASSFLPGQAAKGLRFLGSPVQNTQRGLASALGVNPEKALAFEQSGLQPTLSNISDSRAIGNVENTLRELPIAGRPLESIASNNKVAIDQLGEGLTQEEAGKLAQEGIRNYTTRGNDVAEKLSQNVKRHLQPNENIPISNTSAYIKTEKPNLSSPEAIQQFNNSNVGKEFSKFEALTNRYNGAVPHEDLVYLRKQIDNEISTFGKYGNEEQRALKGLRTNIQKDIGESLKAKSPEAAKDFERFNKFYTGFAAKRERLVNDLTANKTATEVFRNITNNTRVDATLADDVLKTLKPEQKQVFSDSIVKELGMTPQNEFNAATLATNFKKLEPKAQEVILAPMSKEAQKQFRSTIDAIDAIKYTQSLGNKSRTGYTQLLTGLLTGGGGALAGGPVGAIAGPALAIGSGRVLSSTLFTNPKFLSWVSQGAKLKTPEDFASHMTKLERIGKISPQLAPDITEYMNNINGKNQPQAAPQAPVTPQRPTREQALQELQRRKAMQQAAPQLQPQPQPQTTPQSSVNPELLDKIAMMESGGNPNAHAQGSSASGMYQFTNPTWKDAVARYGSETGVRLQDKNNPRAQRIMAERMLKDSAADLKNFLGREAQPTEIYLTHFLGLGGAKKLLGSNPRQFAAAVLPEAARANRSVFYRNGQPLTVAEVYSNFNRKISSRKV